MPHYEISLSLRVDDTGLLWDAAALRALATAGTTMDDVADTIGPRDDADVEACLAMIVDPSALAGCTARSFDCTRIVTTPKPRRARRTMDPGAHFGLPLVAPTAIEPPHAIALPAAPNRTLRRRRAITT